MGGSGLAGTLTVIPLNGIATFSNPSVSSAGSGYTLTATSPGLASATSAAFSISAPAATAAVPAQAADAFVDSVGLNVHFSYYGSVYTSQTPQMLSYLGQLGVRHLRDQMAWQGTSPSSAFYAIHDQLGTMGIKTDFIATSIDYPISQVAAYPGLVNDMEAAEAANEYDATGDPEWATKIEAQQSAIYSTIHGLGGQQSLTVIAPSLAQPQNAPRWGISPQYVISAILILILGGGIRGIQGLAVKIIRRISCVSRR